MSIQHATGALIGPRPPNVSPAARRRGRLILGALLVCAFALGACAGVLFAETNLPNQLPQPPPVAAAADATASQRWTPESRRGAAGNEDLRRILRAVAPAGEVVVTLSTAELVASGALGAWVDDLRTAGVSSFVVFAIDDATRDAMVARDVPVWRAPNVATADDAISNHGVSARKYALLREVVDLGYSPFLLDTDIAVVRNPLDYLHRDADVEAMSDGADDSRAYGDLQGDDDPAMGWSRYSQYWRLWSLNSGCFYLRANERTRALLADAATHLEHQKDWDQSVFTRHVLAPLGGAWPAHGLSLRVLDRRLFQNSKTAFVVERKLPLEAQAEPVLVHVNYHADKNERLAALRRRWARGGGQGDAHALDAFPDAS